MLNQKWHKSNRVRAGEEEAFHTSVTVKVRVERHAVEAKDGDYKYVCHAEIDCGRWGGYDTNAVAGDVRAAVRQVFAQISEDILDDTEDLAPSQLEHSGKEG